MKAMDVWHTIAPILGRFIDVSHGDKRWIEIYVSVFRAIQLLEKEEQERDK